MNSFQSISGDSENSSVTRRGVSRRSVMKAGAAAAWSVPLVQVVAAAPAHATSHAGHIAFVSTPSLTSSGTKTVTVSLKNDGVGQTNALQVILTFPGTPLALQN
ncbi:MAG TPA: hypothetical protein VLB03_05245, partial [Nocardioidaceae bacterium]|nr:hypothetical protein [Nocardioidaceae bacterium]